MEQNQEKLSFTSISEDDEVLTGRLCPKCSYPTVEEFGLEVCYHCGWSEEDEMVEEYLSQWKKQD